VTNLQTPETRFPTVTISQEQHALLVQPACDDVLSRLQGITHRLASDPHHGCYIEETVSSLFRVIDSDDDSEVGNVGMPVGCTMFGLEPVVRRLLQDDFQLDRRNPVAPLPAPQIEAVRERGVVVDDRLLRFVQHHDRGIIRCGDRIDVSWLIAQIALAYPERSIVVASATTYEAERVSQGLRQWLPEDVTRIRAGRFPARAGRIVLGTYEALMGGCMDLHRRQLVIATDAVQLMGERGVVLLQSAVSARLFGLLPYRYQIAPHDADHVRGLFGFEELLIPRHGYKPLPAEVVIESDVRGNIPFDTDFTDLRRTAIWQHPARNRRIARLASALHMRHKRTLRSFKKVNRAVKGRRTERICVLAENVEQAAALAHELPGWELIPGNEVNTRGLTVEQVSLFEQATHVSGDALPSICTLAAVDQIDPRELDVLIRADAASDLPIDEAKLAVPSDSGHRLLLIDFEDTRHHELGRAFRSRRRAYRRNGWYGPGQDPVEVRVEDFLAKRPSPSRN